jgi:hypothetical protein
MRILAALFAILLCGQIAHAQQSVSNLVSGSGSGTDTAAHTIIAAPTSASARRIYVTSAQCFRTDAGTTAIRVTLNDDGGTVIGLPNSGGGGGSNPLTVPAATALTFTASSGVTSVYCNAQGFTGN